MQSLHCTSPLEILIGIDVDSQQHSVAVGLSDGSLVDEFDIDYRPDGFSLFFDRVTKHSE